VLLLRKYDGGCSNFAKQTIVRHIKHRLWQRFHHRSTVLQIHSWSDVKRRNPHFLKKVARRISATADGRQAVAAWQKSLTGGQPPSTFSDHRRGIPCGDSALWKNKTVKRRANHQLCWKRGMRRRAHPLRLTHQQGCPTVEEEGGGGTTTTTTTLSPRRLCWRLPHLQLTVSVLDVLAYSLCALCNFDVCNVFCSILLFM
ncbi:unnamed protein product, partial [Staurois parvus]